MSRIDRIQRAVSARRASKTENDRPDEADSVGTSNLPVPISAAAPPRSFREERPRGYAEFAAQIIGQGGERRGLRAGPSLLERARQAYNRAEWSGSADRRARTGRTASEDI
ncbi:MAG: hypothetical protein KKE02_15825 [Alphaproteobacteria bacterium]|nr:hypothetical protein [Alphaproteobacteria bacterium]MBU1514582.1 hypothetical protein [Alphaproteobacteria bacterium]MBU2096786.1 hypothetical protein [Alphaproteobacteria bacterium]MBU2152490.1 hypothetical protein [Alphaproteobacteria bacterium]MBU2306581.1 hypothetical protein [Alphaproteobacteria bacterium]